MRPLGNIFAFFHRCCYSFAEGLGEFRWNGIAYLSPLLFDSTVKVPVIWKRLQPHDFLDAQNSIFPMKRTHVI